MTARWIACTVAAEIVLVAACGSSDTTASTRPRGVRNAPSPAAAPSTGAPPEPPPPPPPPSVPAPKPVVRKPLDPPKERDYPAELLGAVGDPSACLTARKGAEAPPDLNIDLEAYVMPSGGVGRAYARSALLTEAELDCLRRRLETLRFATPVDDTPRRVTATLRLTLAPKVDARE